MNETWHKGTVKSHALEKGYGFVTGDDGRDYYFSARNVTDGAAAVDMIGMRVRFKAKATPKGMSAIQMKVIERPRLMYANPDRFIVTPDPVIRGTETLFFIDRPLWCLAHNESEARQLLTDSARRMGATGVVNLRLSQFRKGVFKYCGIPVYAKVKVPAPSKEAAQASEAEIAEARAFACDVEQRYEDSYNFNLFGWVFRMLATPFRRLARAKASPEANT